MVDDKKTRKSTRRVFGVSYLGDDGNVNKGWKKVPFLYLMKEEIPVFATKFKKFFGV